MTVVTEISIVLGNWPQCWSEYIKLKKKQPLNFKIYSFIYSY